MRFLVLLPLFACYLVIRLFIACLFLGFFLLRFSFFLLFVFTGSSRGRWRKRWFLF